jgi:hypothetical protein
MTRALVTFQRFGTEQQVLAAVRGSGQDVDAGPVDDGRFAAVVLEEHGDAGVQPDTGPAGAGGRRIVPGQEEALAPAQL